MIRMTTDYGPWRRGEELEALMPGEDLRRGAVDAARYAALVRAGLAAPVEVEAVEEWPLKTPPAEYLERSPNGPRADLARRILGMAPVPVDEQEEEA